MDDFGKFETHQKADEQHRGPKAVAGGVSEISHLLG
jgi:hypothetical protein